MLAVYRSKAFNGLQLDDNLLLDQQIDPEAFVKNHSAIFECDDLLSLDRQTTLDEFVSQDSFIDGLS